MKISTSKQTTHGFNPKEVGSVKELADLITKSNWSNATYNGGHRITKNFEEAHTIAFDIDDGLTIEEAKERVKEYKHIIAPSRSHQIEKGGKTVDRFRIVLFLQEPITNAKDYVQTWYDNIHMFPEADQQCKDAARLWYPSSGVECIKETGKEIVGSKWVAKEKTIDDFLGTESLSGEKGQLSRLTHDFILNGAEPSTFNARLTKAAADMRENLYTQEEAIQRLTKVTGHLDEQDLRTISWAYEKEPRYEPRITPSAFNIKSITDVFNNTEKLTWTVDDLLIDSGLSILAANPKAGKSTISRQLAKCIARGEDFFGRKCIQGRVLYLALEEHEGMLKLQFKKLGVTEEDDILMHVGPLNSIETKYSDLERLIEELNPALTVIDTMHLFTGIKELNSYAEVNIELSKLRKIARNNNTHILTLHHSKKSGGTGGTSLLGSSAIAGAVDCIIEIERVDNDRRISTNQRGGRALHRVPLEFDKDTETYTLGDEDDF